MKFSVEELKDLFNDHVSREHLVVAGGVLAASVVGYGLYSHFSAGKKKKVYPKDVVMIHGAGRGPFCPSLSPFCVKIETYFRMNRIPYQDDKEIVMSSKGKIPWIEYNGESVCDSAFIIKYFNKKLNINIDRFLNDEEKSISRSFHYLIEENLFWCLALSRWVYGYTDNKWCGMGWFIPKMIGRVVKKNAWAAGMGRHTQSEVQQIFEDDIKALSDFLANKKFMMGDNPTELDCTAFGMLSQIVWHSPEQPAEALLKEKFPNLRDYCFRMKDLYWKDWNDCITHGGTREATR